MHKNYKGLFKSYLWIIFENLMCKTAILCKQYSNDYWKSWDGLIVRRTIMLLNHCMSTKNDLTWKFAKELSWKLKHFIDNCHTFIESIRQPCYVESRSDHVGDSVLRRQEAASNQFVRVWNVIKSSNKGFTQHRRGLCCEAGSKWASRWRGALHTNLNPC